MWNVYSEGLILEVFGPRIMDDTAYISYVEVVDLYATW